jgi:predicted signal transduction protein with EAL and GGDEF domain/putative methionine-R-sulfoxide reductase with GAF domain
MAAQSSPDTAPEPQRSRLDRALHMLNSCTRALVRAEREDDLLNEICRLIVEVGGYRCAWVGYVEHDEQRSVRLMTQFGVEAAYIEGLGLRWSESPGGRGPTGRAIRERRTCIAQNVADDPILARSAAVRQCGVASIIALPLIVQDDCIGALDIYSDLSNSFDESEAALLRALSEDLAYGIGALRTEAKHQLAQQILAGERKRQDEQIARLTRILRMQGAINSAILRIDDRDELLQEACRIATRLGGYNVAVISMVDADGRHARPLYREGGRQRRANSPVLEISDGTRPDTSLGGRALRTGQVTVCGDLTRTEIPVVMREVLYEEGIRSIVALPLIVDGVKIGVLTLTSTDQGLMCDDELLLLQDIDANLSFALRSQQQADTVQYLTHFDPITGLAKRALFCQRLQNMLDPGAWPYEPPAVAAFCIEELSRLSDRLGGKFGDLLLREVAERLRHYVDSDDRIGYLGGGIFAFTEPVGAVSDERIAALLDNSLFGAPFQIDGRVVRASGRYGIGRSVSDVDDAYALVQKAEAALKRARETESGYLSEALEIHSEISDRLAFEHKLRRAIDAREFELRYLPQLDLASGRIESVEALLRWNDPEQGLLVPSQFLPALETSGLIDTVGQWVLQRAIEDGIRWQALGIGPVRISVNVAGLQLRRRAFVQHCLQLLDRWRIQVKGYGIDFEITEAAVLKNIDGAAAKLRELRAAGVRIALDDFGSGYSALGLLAKLPLDLIKIERSVIARVGENAAGRSLVAGIIAVASSVGLITVAEGVENRAQLAALRDLDCNQWQGYLYGRPMSAAELEQRLKTPAPIDTRVGSA